jgi:ribonucleotide reductase alpha subunit
VVRSTARAYAIELGIPEPVKVTTVAPTGSIAKLPGATEGIQPIYSRHFVRRVRFSEDDPEVNRLRSSGYAIERDLYSQRTLVVAIPTKDALVAECEPLGSDRLIESADELAIDTLLEVQAMYQTIFADNAVSMTVNLAQVSDPEAVRSALLRHLPNLKGTTLMVDTSRPQPPYERISRADFERSTVQTVGLPDGACLGDACPIGNEGAL